MTDLGPIGHLPVDHQRARDAAAGPRIDIPVQGRATWLVLKRPELPPLVRTDDAWRQSAACRGLDVNLFYPEVGGAQAPDAKAVCASCRVRAECLADGMDERYGIWGGTSDHERIVLRRTRSSERAPFNRDAPFADLVLAVDAALNDRTENVA